MTSERSDPVPVTSDRPTGHSLRKLRSLLRSAGLRPRKELGQCFLIDLNLLRRLVSLAELSAADAVLEVGAGTGSLTELLACAAGVVAAVEIDGGLYRIAREVLRTYPNVVVLRCDALRSKHEPHPLVLETLRAARRAFGCTGQKLVANLPYNIATPLVLELLYGPDWWDRMVVTIQVELAEKMAASVGHPDYGAVSVLAQAVASVRIDRRVPRSAFWPQPEVVSAIVVIEPRAELRAGLPAGFRGWVHRLWGRRRRKLRTALRELTALGTRQLDELLERLGLEGERRVERLTVEDFVRLIRGLQAAVGKEHGE